MVRTIVVLVLVPTGTDPEPVVRAVLGPMLEPRAKTKLGGSGERPPFATFIEDPVGLALIEDLALEDNVMWSNDYPHQEGSWPHSQQAIERQMQGVSEATRQKVLGLNAARVFGFTVPSQRQNCDVAASAPVSTEAGAGALEVHLHRIIEPDGTLPRMKHLYTIVLSSEGGSWSTF